MLVSPTWRGTRRDPSCVRGGAREAVVRHQCHRDRCADLQRPLVRGGRERPCAARDVRRQLATLRRHGRGKRACSRRREALPSAPTRSRRESVRATRLKVSSSVARVRRASRGTRGRALRARVRAWHRDRGIQRAQAGAGLRGRSGRHASLAFCFVARAVDIAGERSPRGMRCLGGSARRSRRLSLVHRLRAARAV